MLAAAEARALELRAKLYRGLADSSRLSILEALSRGPRTVTDIVRGTGLSQPNVSNHLGCLRDCGLVVSEQRGRFVYYALGDERVAQLMRLADELLADAARGVYECTRYGSAKDARHG
jgi:DNA-binding transcriptional ArsR family regulator